MNIVKRNRKNNRNNYINKIMLNVSYVLGTRESRWALDLGGLY